jgi:uncharacterized membrane protein
MDESFLLVLGGAYLLSPVALAIAVTLQARKRRALEQQVLRLTTMVDALGRRVAGAAAAQSSVATETSPASPTPRPGAISTSPPDEAAPGATVARPEVPPPLPPAPPPDAVAPASPPPRAVPPWPPPPPTDAPAAPPRPPRAVDWEALVGVRLFSWVAGVALLVAAVAFLKLSIENGWIGPPMRAAIGALVGAGLLVGAETRRARRYAVTAQALAGAGVAILFATVFAAHALWGLLPGPIAFALLALVTAVAVAYAVRREALVVALLGLVGGFSTPILLSTGEDRPVGLFSYLLVLNVGLAWVAHRRRWPLLGALSLALTALYQLGWVVRFPGAHNLPVGVVVFLVFPAFGFLVLALARRGEQATAASPVTRWAAALGALPPLFFLLHAVRQPALVAHWPLVLGFALLLCVGLLVVAALQGPEWLHLVGGGGALLATLGVVWAQERWGHWTPPAQGTAAWPAILLPILALAATLLAGPRLLAARGRPLVAEGRLARFAAPALLLALALLAWSHRPGGAAPLLLTVAVLALVAGCAAAAAAERDGLLLLATGLLSPWAAMCLEPHVGLGAPAMPLLALLAALGLGALGLAALLLAERRQEATAPGPWFVAGSVALLVAGQLDGVVSILASERGHDGPDELHLLVQFLLLCGLLAVGARTRRHVVSVVAAASTFLATTAFGADGQHPEQALVLAGALYLLQLLVPWWELRRGGTSRLVLWAPALASALFLLLFREHLRRLELAWLVGPVALLQAAALLPHLLVLLRTPGALQAERSRIVVVAGAILALLTAAIPLQLENEWLTIGLALLAAALAWLHGRVPHRGLLLWILGLALAVGVRLALNDAVLHYHPRSGTPVLNFWLYAYGLPALALLAAARLLPRDGDRLRPDLPRLAPLLAALGGLLLFLLLNVEIADAFSPGDQVLVRLRGSLAYDLALTIGWACFAVGLLAVGVVLRARATRIASIALLAVTVVKCFLLDLGRLDGLYRVFSFVGLAVSLALVAVVLQKFVLADREARP